MMKIRVSSRHIAAGFLLSATAAIVFGCGGGAPASTELSDNAKEGLQIAQSNGCASCHGSDFGGGVGPTWKGLADSVRVLTDGSEVIADRDYLVESIVEPNAKVVRGYSLVMPGNGLTAEQVERIVDYITELK